MITYRYKSPIGVFSIIPRNGRWALWFEDDILGMYNSSVAAADDVYTKATGHYDWDSLDSVDGPTDVYEWDKVTLR